MTNDGEFEGGISAAVLSGKSFQFGRVDGSSIAKITLAPDGLLAEYQNANELYWSVEDGKLIFSNELHIATTIFNNVVHDERGYSFTGEFPQQGPGPWHTLVELKSQPVPGIIQELARELYGDDLPSKYSDLTFVDNGYPHTNIVTEIIECVLDVVRPNFWLELGSMLGGSAIRVAEAVKRQSSNTQIVCVDPFSGDVNMWDWEQPNRQIGEWQFVRLYRGKPTIYDRFLANIAHEGHDDIVLPIPVTSIVGIKLIKRLYDSGRITSLPSVIYLDSAHEPDETLLELQKCWELLTPGGVLMGDDWGWEAVRNDVLRFAGSVRLNDELRGGLVEKYKYFQLDGGVLLGRGQWLIAK